MRYSKDGITKTGDEIKRMPEYSRFIFSATGSTFAELGWTPVPDLGPTLAEAKATQRAMINAQRFAANRGTFEHAGKQIACDDLSRSDIDGVAQAVALTGALPAGFPGAWKCADNTYLPIATADAFKAMHASMVAAGTANFMRSEARKAAIDAAATVEDVQAVVW